MSEEMKIFIAGFVSFVSAITVMYIGRNKNKEEEQDKNLLGAIHTIENELREIRVSVLTSIADLSFQVRSTNTAIEYLKTDLTSLSKKTEDEVKHLKTKVDILEEKLLNIFVDVEKIKNIEE